MVGGQERDDGRRDQEDEGGPPPHEHHGEALRRARGKTFQRDNVTTFFKKKINKWVSGIVQKEVYFFPVMLYLKFIVLTIETFETKS